MNENDSSFDSELFSESDEKPQQEESREDPPAASTPAEEFTPQRTDYTRPFSSSYGSRGYPDRPSAAPRAPFYPANPDLNASSQRPSANPRQTPPVNPYSAQRSYPTQGEPQDPYSVQRNPYAAPQNPYRAPQSPYMPYGYSAPSAAQRTQPESQPKKEKKKNTGVRMAIIALCCALAGSLLGGLIVGLSMRSDSDEKTSVSVPATEAARPTSPTERPTYPASEESDPSGKLTPAQIYQGNVSAIVGIANESTAYNVFGQASRTASTGTGFIISADGEILTNYHVVEGAQTLTVTMHDGSTYNAIVLGYEAESDVALIKIEASGLPTVSLGDSDQLNVGDEIAAIGNPLGELTYTMTVGIVSSMDRDVNTDGTPINMMQIDAAINPGNSGGPLFDMYGNVIGITTAKYSGTLNSGATIEGIGFAIPINDILYILDDLRENGTVPDRAYIGITVKTVAASEAMQTPAGAQIDSVAEGSSGAKAGLQAGDIITKIDDKAITSTTDLSKALKKYRAGDSAVLTIFRSGSELTVTVSFDTKPTSAEPQPEETEPEETEYFNPWDFFFP